MGLKYRQKNLSHKKSVRTQNLQRITHWQNTIWWHRTKICFSFLCCIYCWEKSTGCTAQHILWAVSCNQIFYSSDFHTGINYMLYYFCNNHRGLFALPLLGKVTTLNKNSSLSDQLQWRYCEYKPIQVKSQTVEPAGSVCLICRCYFLHKQTEWYQHSGYAIATTLLIFS